MRHVGRWFAKVLGSALCIVLVFVMLPYAGRLAAQWMPDLSGAALVQSATLAREIRSSARLETTTVDEEGVLASTSTAFLIGVVQSVAISYDYHASVGIDLSKVQLDVSDNTITFYLPAPEVLSDSLPPDYTRSPINVTWYTLTDERRQELLEKERLTRRAAVTEEQASANAAWENTVAVFENYIAQWIQLASNRFECRFEPLDTAAWNSA